MRAVGFGLLGLVLGAAAGFWLGLMGGLIYAEAAKVSCIEGLCSAVAVTSAAFCAAGGGIAGAAIGFRQGLRRAGGTPRAERKISAESATRSSV